MSNETTPAVERAARTLSVHIGATQSSGWDRVVARATVAAALNDPGDPDSLARTLFQIHLASDPNLIPGEESLELWPLMSEGSRVHWRAVADGLRTALLGGAA